MEKGDVNNMRKRKERANDMKVTKKRKYERNYEQLNLKRNLLQIFLIRLYVQ
jgi:hypothetical protein